MNKKGLTLVEVIVAAVILSGTVAGLLFIFASEKDIVTYTGRKVEAINFSGQTLEQLKAEVTWPTASELTQGTYTEGDLSFLSLSGTSLGDNFSASREYTVTDIDNGDGEVDYKQVSVKVTWTEP